MLKFRTLTEAKNAFAALESEMTALRASQTPDSVAAEAAIKARIDAVTARAEKAEANVKLLQLRTPGAAPLAPVTGGADPARLSEMTAKIASLNRDLSIEKQLRVTAEQTLADTKQMTVEKINACAMEVLASSGHVPLAIGVGSLDEPTAPNKALKGRAKVVASIAEQLKSANQSQP